MKSILVFIYCLLGIAATAQNNSSISHSINDDGKTLSIKIKGTVDGKPIDYDKTFDVTNMTKEQRTAVIKSAYESVGLPYPIAPRAPLKSTRPITLIAAPAESSAPTISSISQNNESYMVGGEHPYTKEIRYNPATGQLYMKYRFIKNGEEITVEKSFDAKDKSKTERDALIKKYEKEIGLLPAEII